MTTPDTDLKIAVADAVYDFMIDLDTYIGYRVNDRDGSYLADAMSKDVRDSLTKAILMVAIVAATGDRGILTGVATSLARRDALRLADEG